MERTTLRVHIAAFTQESQILHCGQRKEDEKKKVIRQLINQRKDSKKGCMLLTNQSIDQKKTI